MTQTIASTILVLLSVAPFAAAWVATQNFGGRRISSSIGVVPESMTSDVKHYFHWEDQDNKKPVTRAEDRFYWEETEEPSGFSSGQQMESQLEMCHADCAHLTTEIADSLRQEEPITTSDEPEDMRNTNGNLRRVTTITCSKSGDSGDK